MRKIALALFLVGLAMLIPACHRSTAAQGSWTISLGRDGQQHCINESTGEEDPTFAQCGGGSARVKVDSARVR